MSFLGENNRKETWYQRGYLVFCRAGSYEGEGGRLLLGMGRCFRKGRLIQT